MFTIHNAHNKGVSAVAITKDNSKVVSGGGEGQVIHNTSKRIDTEEGFGRN